ncbi:hypothetical protein ACQUEU_09200 [Enterococcus casseliflavus]|uniref:hypothetical protein n=1 Tax=Enterococcus casseliflavus TaxID=37734 RepID=UPI003D0DB45F
MELIETILYLLLGYVPPQLCIFLAITKLTKSDLHLGIQILLIFLAGLFGVAISFALLYLSYLLGF